MHIYLQLQDQMDNHEIFNQVFLRITLFYPLFVSLL